MKGFIYITTNNITGKKYIGKKYYYYSNGKESDWRTYLGSSKLLKKDIEHFGVNNFSREIIDKAADEEILALLEKHYIYEADAVLSEEYYNLSNNVDKFFTTEESVERALRTRERWSDDKRASVSDKMKQSWADNYEERCNTLKEYLANRTQEQVDSFKKVRSEVQKKVMAEMDDTTKQAINAKRSASAKKHWDTLTEDQKQSHVDKRKHALEKMHAATKAKKQAKLQTIVTLVDLIENTETEMTIQEVVDFGIPYTTINQLIQGKYSTHNKYKRRWTVK